jgi:hypothetical protein
MLFLFVNTVSADIIIPGTKSINWCYEVSNINDYPEYVFFYFEEALADYDIIKQGDCFNFYKLGIPHLYAILKTDFDKNKLSSEFFDGNNFLLIKSNISLVPIGPLDEEEPLNKVVITLDIVSIKDDKLTLTKSLVTNTYLDGTVEKKPYSNYKSTTKVEYPPEDSVNPKIWYFTFSWIAFVLICTALVIRKIK